MSAKDTRCGIHNLELEEVRPGKWLCPEPECTHVTTDRQIEQMRELLWHRDTNNPPGRDGDPVYRLPA